MKRDRKVGLRKAGEEPVAQHCARAVNCFFGRLANQNKRAAPLVLQLGEHLRRAQHGGNVNVVAAGMHHAHVLARIVLRLHRTRIGKPGFLVHRQRVEIRAHENRWTVTILHDRNDAIADPVRALEFSDAFGDCVAKRS